MVEIHDASDHFRSTQSGEFGLTMRVHVTVVSGAVLISRPHLSRSSPHVQPIGTSQLGDPSLPGDLRDRVRQVIEAIKNPKPAAQAEPKGKAVALVDAISPQAPPPTAAPAAAPAPAPSVPTATPSLSSPAPTVAESPAPVVERKSPAWPGVVGIAALTVIAVLVWKRRRGRAGSAL